MEEYRYLPARRNIISVRITDDERTFLLRQLERRNMTVSDLIREALQRMAFLQPAGSRKSRPKKMSRAGR